MTKERLREYRCLNQEIQKLEDELLLLESRGMKITTQMSDEPRASSMIHDRMAEAATAAADQQVRINALLTRLFEQRDEVERALDCIPARYRCLMRMRYIDCTTWEQIAVTMSYSWQHVHRLHGEALKILGGEA